MPTALVPDGLHHSGTVGVRIQHQQMGGPGGSSCSSSERDSSAWWQEKVVEVHLLEHPPTDPVLSHDFSEEIFS